MGLALSYYTTTDEIYKPLRLWVKLLLSQAFPHSHQNAIQKEHQAFLSWAISYTYFISYNFLTMPILLYKPVFRGRQLDIRVASFYEAQHPYSFEYLMQERNNKEVERK